MENIDVNLLDSKEMKAVEDAIDEKVTKVINSAEAELKTLLNKYGIGIKIVVGLAKLGEEEKAIEKLIGAKIYKKRKKKVI